MVRRRIVSTLAAALLAACQQGPAADRETQVTDVEVQALLSIAAKVDWHAFGFSALPTSGSIRVFKKSRETARDANDAGLFAEGQDGSRIKRGVHAVYRGPNGIEEIDRTAIARLRAQLQEPIR